MRHQHTLRFLRALLELQRPPEARTRNPLNCFPHSWPLLHGLCFPGAWCTHTCMHACEQRPSKHLAGAITKLASLMHACSQPPTPMHACKHKPPRTRKHPCPIPTLVRVRACTCVRVRMRESEAERGAVAVAVSQLPPVHACKHMHACMHSPSVSACASAAASVSQSSLMPVPPERGREGERERAAERKRGREGYRERGEKKNLEVPQGRFTEEVEDEVADLIGVTLLCARLLHTPHATRHTRCT